MILTSSPQGDFLYQNNGETKQGGNTERPSLQIPICSGFARAVFCCFRRVVQLVERVSPKHEIAGSSPASPAYETTHDWHYRRHGAASE